MKKNTPISQKHSLGCGVACVAFILRLNYLKALKIFTNGSQKANNHGFYCKEIMEVLNKYDLDYTYKYVNNKTKRKIYNDYSIVFIKRSKRYPAGHYLCRYRNLWMDPWINFTENKNIKKSKAGFSARLPGKAIYVVFNKTPNPLSPKSKPFFGRLDFP